MQIRVGCCGPAGLSLSRYADLFETIEINSTFYKLPKKETAQRWLETTKGKVIFCMKAFQGITHPIASPTWRRAGVQRPTRMVGNYGHLKPTNESISAWHNTLEICEAMNARVCIIQLPPSFICSESTVSDALVFFRKIGRPIRLAIEFRHQSWIDSRKLTRKLIADANLIHITDPLKDKPLSETETCYYRLHGLGKSMCKYDYNKNDLQELKKRVLQSSCDEAFVMFNNLPMRENALSFRKIVSH
jgi:uncharacterized protein YecE (DUF72 family)